jgi:hypothetical protein
VQLHKISEDCASDHNQQKSQFLDLCSASTACRRFPWRLPVAAVKRVSSWVGRKVDHTRAFLCHHWHLLRTGESASELVIVFSPIVAASSLAYLGPAACFFATKKLAMTALFSLITFTSLQADSLQPSSKLWCMMDRTVATFAGEHHCGSLTIKSSLCASSKMQLFCLQIHLYGRNTRQVSLRSKELPLDESFLLATYCHHF